MCLTAAQHILEFAWISLKILCNSFDHLPWFIIICLPSGATCAKVAKTIDSGAGFFIEEETAEDEQQEKRVVQQPGDQKWHHIIIKLQLNSPILNIKRKKRNQNISLMEYCCIYYKWFIRADLFFFLAFIF